MKKQVIMLTAAICCAMSANAQIKVKSNGYVGIGTTSPTQKLHAYLVGEKVRLQFSGWQSIYMDTSGLCKSPCIYPSYDWYLQLGRKDYKIGTIFVQTIHVDYLYNDSDSTYKYGFSKLNREHDKFKQLKPYKYKFTKEFMDRMPEKERVKFDHEHYGFKAQDIAKVYPELTYKDDSSGKYSVNYIGFIPILVEMVQELQSTVTAQSLKIKELEQEISKNGNTFKNPRNERKFMVAPSVANYEKEVEGQMEIDGAAVEEDITTNAFLFQNTPNPFSNETEIKYYMPENADNACIYVFSLNGNLLLTKPITQMGNGSIVISNSELEAGMYIYTLAVGGVEVDSKRMILTNE